MFNHLTILPNNIQFPNHQTGQKQLILDTMDDRERNSLLNHRLIQRINTISKENRKLRKENWQLQKTRIKQENEQLEQENEQLEQKNEQLEQENEQLKQEEEWHEKREDVVSSICIGILISAAGLIAIRILL